LYPRSKFRSFTLVLPFTHGDHDEGRDDYYALYSIPTLPFDGQYEIDLDKAVYDRPNMYFVNCSLETLKELARTCLLADQPVWFGCDVGQETNGEAGIGTPCLKC
jgi:bleomycin hydrolase